MRAMWREPRRWMQMAVSPVMRHVALTVISYEAREEEADAE